MITKSRIKDFLFNLVSAAPVFKDPEVRRRIVALNCLMMTYTFFVLLMLCSTFLIDFPTQEEKNQAQSGILLSIPLFLTASILGRTKLYIVGGMLFTLNI